MISGMVRDDSPEATSARLETPCQEVYRALQRGMQTADHLHDVAAWKREADLHLHRHMTRRDAMEDLKQLNPEMEDDDDLGLPMSGLILHLPEDVIRIWHTADSKIPKPTTEAKLRFVNQLSERAIPLIGPGELDLGLPELLPKPHATNNVILQWTAEGSVITRFDLVRPVGVQGGQVAIDWRLSLLGRYTQLPDLQYRLRDGLEGIGEAQAP